MKGKIISKLKIILYLILEDAIIHKATSIKQDFIELAFT